METRQIVKRVCKKADKVQKTNPAQFERLLRLASQMMRRIAENEWK